MHVKASEEKKIKEKKITDESLAQSQDMLDLTMTSSVGRIKTL